VLQIEKRAHKFIFLRNSSNFVKQAVDSAYYIKFVNYNDSF